MLVQRSDARGRWCHTLLLLALLLEFLGVTSFLGVSGSGLSEHPRSLDTAVWFANGCFWERQYAFVKVEQSFGRRSAESITAVSGYAGGHDAGPEGRVCYYGDARSSYATLGHAEAVQVRVSSMAMFEAIASNYFDSFIGSDGARTRPDPMDCCAAYRSAVGLPGGTKSVYYPALVRANTHNMTLRAGHGADADVQNTVWVHDTHQFGFHPAEVYHQFHSNFFASDGMQFVPEKGRLAYPPWYVTQLWREQQAAGAIRPTGCPRGRHW